MANHGGRQASLARAHRPRAPTVRAPAPLTAPLTPLRNPLLQQFHNPTTTTTTSQNQQQQQPNLNLIINNNNHPYQLTQISPNNNNNNNNNVTLSAPRPETERTTNEYVETPFRPTVVCEKVPAPSVVPRPQRIPIRTPLQVGTPITKQPTAFLKNAPNSLSNNECPSGNIICQNCGKCKCESCKLPRPLPQRWVCDNSCLCSAETIIDYASCLCCVKGLYYHCSETDAGATCADDPCSCAPSRRLARWSCLSALATVLPCLLCYWPLRGCQRAVEAAYARHSRAGCRCPPRPHHINTPEKRLLDSSPDF